jgi:SAM-dependent methyltransferase
LFSHIKAQKVVLTDISPKMLGICRERLRQAMPERVQSFDFATYSGTERCFRDDSFDSCFGTAVVHHITDVPAFLEQVNDLLKPGGFAFFMEPNRSFHRALAATMAEVVSDFLRDGTIAASDSSRMLNWTAEVHCNIVNMGDTEVLAEREDKHLFDGATFLNWARDAGFGGAAALPCDPDPTGWGTMQNYLQQFGITPGGFAALAQAWPAKSRRHFAALTSNDQSPSYLFWLRKVTWPAAALRDGPMTQGPGPVRALPTEFWVSAGAKYRDDTLEINLSGWCLADVPVASVQIVVGDIRRRLPIWLPRSDVQSAVNAKGLYPVLHAMCSGFEGVIRDGAGPRRKKTIDLVFQVICCDGSVLDAGVVSLTIGAASDLTHHKAINP